RRRSRRRLLRAGRRLGAGDPNRRTPASLARHPWHHRGRHLRHPNRFRGGRSVLGSRRHGSRSGSGGGHRKRSSAMIFDNLTSVQKKEFPAWVKRFPGGGVAARGATVVFPHAGGAATGYRKLATALAAGGGDTYVVQYPQRAERLNEPAAQTV